MPDEKDMLIQHLKEEVEFLRGILSKSLERTPKKDVIEAVVPITGKKIEVKIPYIIDDKDGHYRQMNQDEQRDFLGTLREVTGIEA